MAKIIGLSGLAGSGKSTVASILTYVHCALSADGARHKKIRWTADSLADGVEIAFADPLKFVAMDLFGFSIEQLWGPSELRNAPDMRYPRKYAQHDGERRTDAYVCRRCGAVGTPYLQESNIAIDGKRTSKVVGGECVDYLTSRLAAQRIGTEVGRELYAPLWIEIALRHVADQTTSPVVISDTRFMNEAQAIKDAGGEVWFVERKGAGLLGVAGQHASERELLDVRALSDVRIINDGSLADLRTIVAAQARVSGLLA